MKSATWLLKQQYVERHPYTGAEPGGWAWTDLPGGVPDCDDTPGAVIVLCHLGPWEQWGFARNWMGGLQNRDGGWPTFCRGWGLLAFDRSGSDLTAHALRAYRELSRSHGECAPSMHADCRGIASRAASPIFLVISFPMVPGCRSGSVISTPQTTSIPFMAPAGCWPHIAIWTYAMHRSVNAVSVTCSRFKMPTAAGVAPRVVLPALKKPR